MKINGSISAEEYILFRDYIIKNCGIFIPPEKAYLVETRLSRLMANSGTESFNEFFDYIVSNKNPLIPQLIIDAIATNETLWFRDTGPWKYLEEVALPYFIENLTSGKKTRIRIWSAGASAGQEIYSTVMCIDNYLNRNRISGISLSDFDFYATDVSKCVLEIAKQGRYNKLSIPRG
jgi:chemotaxis protein methyltransferase CheR